MTPVKQLHPICGLCMVKVTLTDRTMQCPKCKLKHVFPYGVVFVEKEIDYSQRKHIRGNPRGRHRNEK